MKMALSDYNFVVEPRQLCHLARHIENDADCRILGSCFMEEVFLTPQDLAEVALGLVGEKYRGVKMELEVDFPYAVGYDGIICLENLPEGAEVSRERRSRHGNHVNVVRGLERPRTNHMVVVVGPKKTRGRNRKHIIYTAYCGTKTPMFRDPGYGDFWKNHGFILEDSQDLNSIT